MTSIIRLDKIKSSFSFEGCTNMEKNKICSFFGHREIAITEELYATTTAEIMKAVDLGCRVFYFGGYGAFDALCYEIVTKIKEDLPEKQIQRV